MSHLLRLRVKAGISLRCRFEKIQFDLLIWYLGSVHQLVVDSPLYDRDSEPEMHVNILKVLCVSVQCT